MTRVPMGGFNLSPNPALLQDYPAVYMSMGQTAENVAERYAVSRVEQEEMAVRSHAKAVAAREAGLLREEIVAIDTPPAGSPRMAASARVPTWRAWPN